ncbi:hypothetical protein JCM10908_006299 [Rhodotorula pacifica]|uniref:uncharacterized protein n=1 Tax=Rhodotorula pacifica TaxID=1495444 RepID=UPI0031729F37
MAPVPRSASPEPLLTQGSQYSGDEKHVSFHPLALRITTAPDGEPEQAMIINAREELARTKRRVGVRTYSWDTPQIGDATSKAWHSMLNGFSATLEPFLNSGGPASSGGVCSSSTSYRREGSPDRSSSRSRSRSEGRSDGGGRARSGSRGTANGDERDDPTSPLYDPTFIPSSRPRLSLKLPTIKRTVSRSAESDVSPTACLLCPRKSILRARSTSPASPVTSSVHTFPDLARVASPPPPPYHEPTSPTVSDVVPILPCCSACEKATLYGREATRCGSYEEKWSRGARKMRQEAEKREVVRAEWRKAAEQLGDKYRCPIGQLAKSRRSSASEAAADEEDDDDVMGHPDCPSNRLGELVKRSGHVDELGGARVQTTAADELESVDEVSEGAATSTLEEGEPQGPEQAPVETLASSTLLAPAPASEPAPLALDAAPPPLSTPPAPSTASAASERPIATRTQTEPSEPAARPVGGRRRFSSISRIAASLGGGLLSSPGGNATGLRT